METTPLKNFTNQYAISKTLRFGLTLKNSEKKNKSHEMLKNLLIKSEQLIKRDASKGALHAESKLVNYVSQCIDGIKSNLQAWEDVYRRSDQIALTKDYYRRLARKACFDGFWEDKGRKQPQSQLIKLSSLKKKHEGKERKEYILDYWADNIRHTGQKLHEFEIVLQQYKTALDKQDKAHTKPRLVDFRKMFLSLARLCNETLVQLNNDSICFPELEKLADDKRNAAVKEFALQKGRVSRKDLAEKIKEIKGYFENNGGYAPFGKVTLNRYTAEQKPQNFKKGIEDILTKLKLIDLIKKLINQPDELVSKYFAIKDADKKQLMNDESLSLVARVQMFKNKPVPVAVRFMLSKYLCKYHQFDKEKVDRLFEKIGEPVSIGQEYAKSKDKSDFELSRYPLKLAFDYSWENVAKSMHNAVDFPKEKCIRFLKDVFAFDTANSALKNYAALLFIKENLATLEHEENSPKDREKFSHNIQKTFKQLNLTGKDAKYEKDILVWIDKAADEQKTLKAKNETTYKNYGKAKHELGLLRGRQKNNIKSYKAVTEVFKDLSVAYGRFFADLREKLREENELNKISHFGIVIEDANKDRYALLTKLDENRTTQDNILLNDEKCRELKTYQVKSLTSKTLEKLIKNKGAYKNFHSSKEGIDFGQIKRDWTNYKNVPAFVSYVKDCLQNSAMAREQNWAEFSCDFSKCNTYEEIEKELDSKAHILQPGNISRAALEKLVNKEECLLLPFVNQDITSAKRELKNQFSKDWAMLFDDGRNYRLHPEFKIVYRQPTPGYPNPGEKRYSRFQMVAHLLCEFIPESRTYLSRKQQIQIFNDQNEQSKQVDEFNKRLKPQGEFYVLGIDRGLKQLATLCVLNQCGKIQGDFEIYTRAFDTVKKEWQHSLLERLAILDLSNLRVETKVDGEKVLVDLASIPVKDGKGEYTRENQQKIKLKQLAYIRKLQYQMQFAEDKVLKFFEENPKPEDIEIDIGELITPYKEGTKFADLPTDKIFDMLTQYKEYAGKSDAHSEKAKREIFELDSAEELKSGVVANMVGVVAYLLEKYKYNAFISLENLCRAFGFAKDGLTGDLLASTAFDETMDFKDQENLVLAGLGTYHFFEMQLLKKLFRIQKEKDIYHLVPAFRSVDNYETIRKLTKENSSAEFVCKPYGIVHFVDPKFTSKKCPVCESTKVNRDKKRGDIIVCKECGFQTAWAKQSAKNNDLLTKHHKQDLQLQFIQNGDDNGAYHIALKTLRNIKV